MTFECPLLDLRGNKVARIEVRSGMVRSFFCKLILLPEILSILSSLWNQVALGKTGCYVSSSHNIFPPSSWCLARAWDATYYDLIPEILGHAYSLTRFVSYHFDYTVGSCRLADRGIFLNYHLDYVILLFDIILSISHPIFLDLDGRQKVVSPALNLDRGIDSLK